MLDIRQSWGELSCLLTDLLRIHTFKKEQLYVKSLISFYYWRKCLGNDFYNGYVIEFNSNLS